MRNDEEIQRGVLDALRQEPGVDAAQIGVTARHGVVTLTGLVPRYAQKRAVEQAAKRVYGVKAVADDVEVGRGGNGSKPTDADIAEAALDVLRWAAPDERVKVIVEHGRVRLEGTVDWQYRRDAAERAVGNLAGVHGVSASIAVAAAPGIHAGEVKQTILDAFRRNAESDAQQVGVEVKDGNVALHGHVRSWAEAEAARQAARAVPGVAKVEDDLLVTP
jgi:osmotically-inducible protein OsmY